MLKELFNKSPISSNKKILESEYKRGSGKQTEYNLFSWITGEKSDRWVSFAYMGVQLNKYGYTSQEYYDVVILGISDEIDRPKCRNCGSFVEFESLSRGYRDFCNLSCTAIWGNKVPSKRLNVSKALTGKKLSKKHREALSRGAINRLTKSGMINGYYKSKKGCYKSKKSNEELIYDSQYELDFIKLCDLDKTIKNIARADIKIPYLLDGITKNYLPDFIITTIDGNKILVEIKPNRMKYWDKNLLKSIAGRKYCKKNNLKYLLVTEDILYKNKDTNKFMSDFII